MERLSLTAAITASSSRPSQAYFQLAAGGLCLILGIVEIWPSKFNLHELATAATHNPLVWIGILLSLLGQKNLQLAGLQMMLENKTACESLTD